MNLLMVMLVWLACTQLMKEIGLWFLLPLIPVLLSSFKPLLLRLFMASTISCVICCCICLWVVCCCHCSIKFVIYCCIYINACNRSLECFFHCPSMYPIIE